MHSKWNLWLLAGLAISLGACSSSQTLDGETPPEEVPAAEAGTDAVPSTTAEAPAAPTEDVKLPDEAPGAPTEAKAPDALPQVDAVPADTKPADSAAPAPMADAKPSTDTTPAAAPADTSSSSTVASSFNGNGESQEYTIQKGDTLMQIAYETYGDLYQWKKIYEMNKDKISNPSHLAAGTVLKLEKPSAPVALEKNGERYMIKSGDTLGTIADDVYGTKKKWRKLWENNRTLIKNPNRIFAGFYLYYTMTPEEKQQADELKSKKELAPSPMAQQDAPSSMAAPAAPTTVQAADMNAAPAAAPQAMAPAAPGVVTPDTRAPAAAQ